MIGASSPLRVHTPPPWALSRSPLEPLELAASIDSPPSEAARLSNTICSAARREHSSTCTPHKRTHTYHYGPHQLHPGGHSRPADLAAAPLSSTKRKNHPSVCFHPSGDTHTRRRDTPITTEPTSSTLVGRTRLLSVLLRLSILVRPNTRSPPKRAHTHTPTTTESTSSTLVGRAGPLTGLLRSVSVLSLIHI